MRKEDIFIIPLISMLTGFAILNDSDLIFLSLYGSAILIGFSLIIFGLIRGTNFKLTEE